MQRSELKHHLLQAISRSNVRNHVSGVCGKATVYMIAAPATDPAAVIEEAFPGVNVREWNPPSVPLTGRARDAAFAVENALIASGGSPVAMKVVRDSIGMKQPNFSRLLKRDDVRSYLHDKGIRIENGKFLC